jgi:hypothetical protein
MTPRLAVWLVSLFTRPDETESILGDLAEEYSQHAANSGDAAARRWYWRQVARTIVHLAFAGMLKAPMVTAACVVAGSLLGRYAFALPKHGMEVVLDHYRLFESSPEMYLFWLTDATQILRLFGNVLAGSLIALAVKGREVPTTIALALVRIAMAIAAIVATLGRPGPAGYFWTFPWVLAFAIANIAGGVIVRTRRSAALQRT